VGVKPWNTIASAKSPDGTPIELCRRDDEYVIRAGGRDLMSSRANASEKVLATLGCAFVPPRGARVLIGGLGMGFTLRAALDRLSEDAEVRVAELSGDVIAWNRGPLAGLASNPCADPRVTVELSDVAVMVAKAGGERGFDAILLDVDNGPEAIAQSSNARLYSVKGLTKMAAALVGEGTLAIWSAGDAPELIRRMEEVGFAVEAHRVPSSRSGGRRNVIFVGRASAR
jgi:spermidine synthase